MRERSKVIIFIAAFVLVISNEGRGHAHSLGSQTGIAHTPIVFELNGKKREIPFVGVTINQKHCWFVLDSGANMMMISSSAALRLGLSLEPDSQNTGNDHVGNPMKTISVLPFSMKMDQSSTSLENIRAISSDLPSNMEKEGICGMLSPQSLIKNKTVILDFPNESLEIHEAESSDKILEFLKVSYPAYLFSELPVLEAKSSEGKRIPSLLLIPASLIEKPEMVLDIDSGSPITHMPENYVQPTCVEPSNYPMQTASGEIYYLDQARNQLLEIGGHPVHLDRLFLLSTPSTPFEGVLGMDVLRRMIIVVPSNPENVYLGL